jgi:hypothetical protein
MRLKKPIEELVENYRRQFEHKKIADFYQEHRFLSPALRPGFQRNGSPGLPPGLLSAAASRLVDADILRR